MLFGIIIIIIIIIKIIPITYLVEVYIEVCYLHHHHNNNNENNNNNNNNINDYLVEILRCVIWQNNIK